MVVAILNTGGTWSKEYNPLTGELFVPNHTQGVSPFLKAMEKNCHFSVEGIVFKDSLEMTHEDRREIASWIVACESENILVLHGTDTMDQTAMFVAQTLEQEGVEKNVIFTGSMVPVMIDPCEFGVHLGIAMGGFCINQKPSVRIAMHGMLLPFDEIEKNREEGIFQKKLIVN